MSRLTPPSGALPVLAVPGRLLAIKALLCCVDDALLGGV